MQSEKRRIRDRNRYKKARALFHSLDHLKEPEIQHRVQYQNPHFVSLDRAYRPDFWDPNAQCFVEIKMASKILIRGFFDLHSKHFPKYYFKRMSLKGREYLSIDNLIDLYPKPLLLKLYNLHSGEFLGEKFFPSIIEKNKIEKEENKNHEFTIKLVAA